MSRTSPTLELHDVLVTHGGRRLVDVPHLALEPGRPVTIVGESGSGKSLLAHALMGTLASTLEVDGKLVLDETVLALDDPANRRALWGRELAMLPQEPALALDPTMRDLAIRPGERIALSGPSGVGKTTLGNALLHLVRVDRGEVVHDRTLASGRMQKLYQDPALSFPPLVPIEVGLRDVSRRHRVGAGRVEELVAAVHLPAGLLARRPSEVSGGELQRIAIVRALLTRPRLVLADEATSRLDLLTQQVTIEALMTGLDDAALVMVTHDRSLASATADRQVLLPAGNMSA